MPEQKVPPRWRVAKIDSGGLIEISIHVYASYEEAKRSIIVSTRSMAGVMCIDPVPHGAKVTTESGHVIIWQVAREHVPALRYLVDLDTLIDEPQ